MTQNIWKKLERATFLALVGISIALLGESASAQSNIIPDETLGNENSEVRTDEIKGNPAEVIEGGAQRGANLFHSFSEFNVENGRGAYFANPGGIENIFSRVTGANSSEILGTLGVSGNADLFFINPNGIIFGENARLDVGGSFVATTADEVQFGEVGFSASEPNAPPLLTVQPSALFFNQMNAERIENQSTATAGVSLAGEPLSGLKVPNGESLLLIGGDVKIDGGGLNALGGRVELGGLAATGNVGLSTKENNLSFNFPEDVKRANVWLTNGASVDVTAEGGGSIFINANNLELAKGSSLLAGIEAGSETPNALPGDIILNATEEITLSQASKITNQVEETAIGNGGNIELQASSLTLKDGSFISASTFGKGNAGSVRVQANSVLLAGESSQGKRTDIVSQVGKKAIGNGGEVEIETGSLTLKGGAFISASTFGKGNGSSVRVRARESVLLEGEWNRRDGGAIVSRVGKKAIGNGGEVEIDTDSLTLKDGARLSADTFGEGNGGSVTVRANSILLEGESSTEKRTDIVSRVGENAIGNGGEVEIETGSLILKGGAVVSGSTFGKGNGSSVRVRARESVLLEGESSRGDGSAIGSRVGQNAIGNGGEVEIETGSLILKGGARLTASSFGEGNAGIVRIEANSVLLEEESSQGFFSTISSVVEEVEEARGNAGKVDIKTDSLTLKDGARLTADTLSEGDGGSVMIQASSVLLAGESSQGKRTDIVSRVGENARGNGGEVEIETGSLILKGGAVISGSTFGKGDGGSVRVRAQESVLLEGESSRGDGSAIGSRVGANAVGNGRNVEIDTDSLTLKDGGRVDYRSIGRRKCRNNQNYGKFNSIGRRSY